MSPRHLPLPAVPPPAPATSASAALGLAWEAYLRRLGYQVVTRPSPPRGGERRPLEEPNDGAYLSN